MSELTQYIGYIRETNGFYYFRPVYIVNPDSIEQIRSNDAKLKFPELGNIHLYSREKSYVRERFNHGDIVVLTFAESDLEDNVWSDGSLAPTRYMIDPQKFEEQDKIKRLADIKMYPVLHPVNRIDFTKTTIPLKDEYVDVHNPCLIVDEGVLYGPYDVKLDENRKAFVNRPGNYIVNSYRSKSGKLDNTVIQIYAPETIVNSYQSKGGKLDDTVIQIYTPGTSGISIIRIDDKLIYESLDKIPDQELFQAFQSSLENRKDHSPIEIPPELVEEYVNSAFRGVPDNIIRDRVRRVRQFVDEQFRQEKSLEDISRFVADMLFTYGEKAYFSNLMEYVLNDNDLARKIQSFAIVEDRLEDKRRECKELETKCEEVRKKWEEEEKDHNRQISEVASETSEEIRNLNIEKERLQKEIDEIRLQYNDWKEIKDLNVRKQVLKLENDKLEKQNQEYEENGKRAEAELNARLKAAVAKNSVNAVFDGKIADQVLQAAAKWNQTSQDENFERIAAILTGANGVPCVPGEDLVKYLISSVKRYRPGYSRNDILNIFICITQNFLTVFSGEPGTGKTSISNIVAHILGTSKIKDYILEEDCFPEESGIELSRYVPISIERGWTSKRDFIGYYNPLSQTFEQANKHLYDGLRLLNAEGEKSKYPYLVLLDEANLSPIEYYWADFMNLCDSNSRFSKITLGNDIQLQIPPTLRFLATINNDDTTERLSPRLIDRAALIHLPDVLYTEVKDEELNDTSFVHMVEWADLQGVFIPVDSLELDPVPNKIYEEICKLFRENMRLSISPRVDRAIKRYWAAAKDLFESEKGSDPAIIALDYAAAQKLLPKINGSGKTYSELLGKFLELCEKHNLEKSRTMLANIIRRGDTSMGYYQYF